MTSLHSSSHDLFLPNAELGDTANIQSTIDRKFAADGTRRVYVRSNPEQLLSYTFRLFLPKAEELKVFLDNNYNRRFRLHNHKDEDWSVVLVSNPLDFVQVGPQEVTINLQFQGSKL
jgi:hypothetical protein